MEILQLPTTKYQAPASVLPQASRQKSLDSQKNSPGLKKNLFALKFAVLLEMMHLFTLLPESLCIICKFAKIDHVEDWKI